MRHSTSLALSIALGIAWLAAAAAGAHPFDLEGLVPGPSRLGVQLQPMTPELRAFLRAPEDRGVLVVKVGESTPAEKAGLRVGDVIVAAGGEAVRDPSDVVARVLSAEENATLELEVVREGEAKKLGATLAGKPFHRAFQERMEQLGPELEKRMQELERRLEELERRLRESLAEPERTT